MTPSKRQRRLAKHKPGTNSEFQPVTRECVSEGHTIRLSDDGTLICMCAPMARRCIECRQVWPCEGAS